MLSFQKQKMISQFSKAEENLDLHFPSAKGKLESFSDWINRKLLSPPRDALLFGFALSRYAVELKIQINGHISTNSNFPYYIVTYFFWPYANCDFFSLIFSHTVWKKHKEAYIGLAKSHNETKSITFLSFTWPLLQNRR